MADNLPDAVTKVGGALEKVVTELERYTDKRYPLTRESQFALARIVESDPQLNTEGRVALLVDAFSFHGVTQHRDFMQIVQSHGIDRVCFALDYLYQTGERGRGHDDEKRKSRPSTDYFDSLLGLDASRDDEPEDLSTRGVEFIREVAELIELLERCGVPVEEHDAFYGLVLHLGGLDAAIDADAEQIKDRLSRPSAHFDPETSDER